MFGLLADSFSFEDKAKSPRLTQNIRLLQISLIKGIFIFFDWEILWNCEVFSQFLKFTYLAAHWEVYEFYGLLHFIFAILFKEFQAFWCGFKICKTTDSLLKSFERLPHMETIALPLFWNGRHCTARMLQTYYMYLLQKLSLNPTKTLMSLQHIHEVFF